MTEQGKCWYCQGQLKRVLITYEGSDGNFESLFTGDAKKREHPVKICLAAECVDCGKTYLIDGTHVAVEASRQDLSVDAQQKSCTIQCDVCARSTWGRPGTVCAKRECRGIMRPVYFEMESSKNHEQNSI